MNWDRTKTVRYVVVMMDEEDPRAVIRAILSIDLGSIVSAEIEEEGDEE